MLDGKGVLNWEHSNKGEDIIGAVIYAHKILKKEDCENDRQRKYWDFVKKPFVYIIGELFEDEEHPGAIAVAAMIRYYAKKNEKLLVGFSIEGATLERKDYILAESVGRRVACTLRPCNHTAIAGLYEDPKTKDIAKAIDDLSKTVDASLIEVDSIILDDMFMPRDPVVELHKAIEDLNKTLTAGMGNVAPSQLVGGAALTKEYISGFQRNRLKAAVRDWDRKRPLKEVVKAALPEVDENYIHHFADLAEELTLKKSNGKKLVRIGATNAHPQSDDDQKKLIEGVYHDPSSDFTVGHHSYGGIGTSLLRGRNDAGTDVLLKYRSDEGQHKINQDRVSKQYDLAHKHYQIMKDVFNLGKHVPAATVIKHPEINGGNSVQVQEHVKGSKTPLESDSIFKKALDIHAKDGHMHKIVLANHILGVTDRHNGNVLVHPKGHLMTIDHDDAFKGWMAGSAEPDLIDQEQGSEPLHPEAAKWIKSIDPRKLAGKMLDQGHDPKTIKTSVSGLKYYQKLADRPGMSIGEMFGHAANHMTAMSQSQDSEPKKAV